MPYTRLLLLALGLTILNMLGCSSKPLAPEKEASSAVTDAGVTQGKPGKKLDPQATATFNRALKAMQQNNSDEALVLFQEMTNSYPGLSGSHTNIGLIHYKNNDFELAESAFQQALKIKPDNAIAHTHIGIIYRKQGRFTDAEQEYMKAIQADPNYANAHLNIGILYDIYLRKLSVAIQHYEKFQALQAEEDKTVKKWLLTLKRRQKASK